MIQINKQIFLFILFILSLNIVFAGYPSIEYQTNHLVLASKNSNKELRAQELSFIVYADLDLTNDEFNLIDFTNQNILYYRNYSYGAGPYLSESFCVYEVNSLENGLLPDETMHPYKITGMTFKCSDDHSYQFRPYINGASKTNFQAYFDCEYDYNLSLDESKDINITIIINYESSNTYFENNGIIENIFTSDYSNPTYYKDSELKLSWFEYTQSFVSSTWDSGDNICIESADLSQKFKSNVNLTCKKLVYDEETDSYNCYYSLYEPEPDGLDSGIDSINQEQETTIETINQVVDDNQDFQDKISLIKQQTTNQIIKTHESNYSVIDFLISICEFIITLILVLYYFIVIMMLGFIFTYYIPKVILIFPNMIEKIINNKRDK